jgi:hypothetical protein
LKISVFRVRGLRLTVTHFLFYAEMKAFPFHHYFQNSSEVPTASYRMDVDGFPYSERRGGVVGREINHSSLSSGRVKNEYSYLHTPYTSRILLMSNDVQGLLHI